MSDLILDDGRVVKTGARQSPLYILAAAIPHQIVGDTPPNFLRLPSHLDMWDNDHDGDCVTAEEAFARACSGIFIQTSEVIRWAKSHGVLNGADLSSVLDWMAEKGFVQDGNTYNAGSKVSVDWTNAAVLQNAIVQGPVKIAVAASQLKNAGQHNGWWGLNYRHDSSIDHCTSLCGYGTLAWLAQQFNVSVPSGVDGNKQGYAFYTWSTVGILDVQSMLNITAEAWLRTPTTVTVGTNPPTPDPVTVNPPPGPPPSPPPPPVPPVLHVPQQPVTWNGIHLPGVYVPAFDVPLSVPTPQHALGIVIPWGVIIAFIQEAIKQYGPLAVPIIEAWLAKQQRIPAWVLPILDKIIEALLGKPVKLDPVKCAAV